MDALRHPPRRAAARLLPLLLAAVTAGCGSSVDGPVAPPPPDDGVSYLPAPEVVDVVRHTWLDFQVVPPAGRPLTVRWHRADDTPQPGERYRYFGNTLGTEHLEARITDESGHAWIRRWAVSVVPTGVPRVDFLPAGQETDAYVGVTATFTASTRWPVLDAGWQLDGHPAGTDTLLHLTPEALGPRVVSVRIETPDTTATHSWNVNVLPFAAAAPPAVTGLALAPGDAPGRCFLFWDPVTASVLPVAAYEVRFRWDGPPTAESWDADHDPGDVDWFDGTRRIKVPYAPEGAGLEPDREVWFAVRARNDRGQVSPVAETVHMRLPGQWWIEGTVTAPDGSPVAGVRVRDHDHAAATATAADGSYRLGPYFELTPVVMEAGTDAGDPPGVGWHIARSDSLRYGGTRRQDFLLIPRLGSAPGCFAFGSSFLKYLRTMTRTWVPSTRRDNVNLYRWAEYPVTVYVPDWVSDQGVDYGACAREAVRIWNDTMGEDYFTIVPDSSAAHVAFRYSVPDLVNYASVVLDQPGGGDYIIGEVPPEHATVHITPIVPDTESCTELALHELGHVLGLIDHAFCNTVPYLMNISALHSLDDGWERAIHPDEQRAVHLIRQLPEGWDMGLYPLDVP